MQWRVLIIALLHPKKIYKRHAKTKKALWLFALLFKLAPWRKASFRLAPSWRVEHVKPKKCDDYIVHSTFSSLQQTTPPTPKKNPELPTFCWRPQGRNRDFPSSFFVCIYRVTAVHLSRMCFLVWCCVSDMHAYVLSHDTSTWSIKNKLIPISKTWGTVMLWRNNVAEQETTWGDIVTLTPKHTSTTVCWPSIISPFSEHTQCVCCLVF